MVHLSFSKDNFVPDTDVSDNIINIDQDAHEIQHFFYSMDMIGGGEQWHHKGPIFQLTLTIPLYFLCTFNDRGHFYTQLQIGDKWVQKKKNSRALDSTHLPPIMVRWKECFHDLHLCSQACHIF